MTEHLCNGKKEKCVSAGENQTHASDCGDNLKTDKKKLNLALQLVIVVGIAAITLWLMFRGKDAGEIIKCLKNADKRWLLLGAALMVGFVFGESIQLKMMFDGMKQKVSLFKCFLLSNVEYFFAQITPGASGGQPIQMVYMTRLGIDVLVGALACMMIAVLYKAAFLLIFLLALLFRSEIVLDSISQVPFLFTFGVLFQLASISFLLTCILRPSLASAMVNGLISFGAKLRIVKHPEKTKEKVQASIKRYKKGSEFLKSHKLMVLRMFLYTVVQRLAYFSVTFCVAKSLGIQHVDWFGVVTVQAILSLSVDALPLPGAAGANELVFINLQRRLFVPELMGAGLLLNRGITYYFLLISCCFFTLMANVFARRKRIILAEDAGEELNAYNNDN